MFGVLLSNPVGVGVGVGALHTSASHGRTPPQPLPRHIKNCSTASLNKKKPHVMVVRRDQVQQESVKETPHLASSRSILKKGIKPVRPPPPVFTSRKPKTSVHFEASQDKELNHPKKKSKRLRNSESILKNSESRPARKMILISAIVFFLICGAAVTGGILSYKDQNHEWTQQFKPTNIHSDIVVPLLKRTSRQSEYGFESNSAGTGKKKMFTDQIVSFEVHQRTELLNAKIEKSIDCIRQNQKNYVLTRLNPRTKWCEQPSMLLKGVFGT